MTDMFPGRHTLAFTALAVVALACSSSETPSTPSGLGSAGGAGGAGGTTGSTAATGTTTSTTSTGTGGGNPNAVVGGFNVKLVAADATTSTPAFTDVGGKVYDGAVPSAIIWTVADSASGCELKTPKVPFCSTACGGVAVCASDDNCVPYPTGQDLGKVHVIGVGPTEFDMVAIVAGYAPDADVHLPNPPAAEGAEITISTAGGAYAPFTVTSKSIAPLVVSGTAPMPLVSGQPLTLEWTKPGNADVGRIAIKVDISHHGGPKGVIECDVADSGSFEIPAALVTKLIMLGVAGFPSVLVRREAVGWATIQPGRVALTVSAAVDRALSIAGVVSCNDKEDCGGRECMANRTCPP